MWKEFRNRLLKKHARTDAQPIMQPEDPLPNLATLSEDMFSHVFTIREILAPLLVAEAKVRTNNLSEEQMPLVFFQALSAIIRDLRRSSPSDTITYNYTHVPWLEQHTRNEIEQDRFFSVSFLSEKPRPKNRRDSENDFPTKLYVTFATPQQKVIFVAQDLSDFGFLLEEAILSNDKEKRILPPVELTTHIPSPNQKNDKHHKQIIFLPMT